MTDIAATLRAWQDVMQESEKQMNAVYALFGCQPESPLSEAVSDLQSAYTRLVAEHIGWDVDALVDWWCTNRFGERPMRIGFPGEPLRAIGTIDGLAAFIVEDLARSESGGQQ